MSEEIDFDDDAHDARYFECLFDLLEKNSNRYEIQTEVLLKNGSLTVEFSGAVLDFKITPTGCFFFTSDSTGARTTDSWLRMGWGKSAKRKALPDYFAQAEASVLINREQG